MPNRFKKINLKKLKTLTAGALPNFRPIRSRAGNPGEIINTLRPITVLITFSLRDIISDDTREDASRNFLAEIMYSMKTIT